TSGEIINHEVELTDLDFRPLLLRTRKDPADAIFVNLGLQQIGIMLQQIRELNINTPRLSNFWAYGRTNFDTAGAQALEGLVFVMPSLNKQKFNELAGLFRLAEATAPVYTCFASMAAILEVFEKNTNLDGPRAVAQALKRQNEVALPDEQLKMENRLALFPLDLMVFRGGKLQLYSE
ncbi:MAG TPA: hypothetical protein PLP17_16000, partial [Oligoflexia bacterium]|nr:hypothetical protein [Oligoflexia bacterium]